MNLNRWGNIVLEKTFSTTAGVFEPLWDGTSAGSVTNPGSVPAREGVYYYRMKLVQEIGEDLEVDGFLHLVR